MPVSITERNTIVVDDGDVQVRTLTAPVTVLFEVWLQDDDDYNSSVAELFAKAAVWLHKHPDVIVVAQDLQYSIDDGYRCLTLVVENVDVT